MSSGNSEKRSDSTGRKPSCDKGKEDLSYEHIEQSGREVQAMEDDVDVEEGPHTRKQAKTHGSGENEMEEEEEEENQNNDENDDEADDEEGGQDASYTIYVPEDDDTCGENLDLAGRSFQAKIVLYHKAAKAWVIRHVDTGAHFFVNSEFFENGIKVPKPTRHEDGNRREMECMLQPNARDDGPTNAVGGRWERGYLLLIFGLKVGVVLMCFV